MAPREIQLSVILAYGPPKTFTILHADGDELSVIVQRDVGQLGLPQPRRDMIQKVLGGWVYYTRNAIRGTPLYNATTENARRLDESEDGQAKMSALAVSQIIVLESNLGSDVHASVLRRVRKVQAMARAGQQQTQAQPSTSQVQIQGLSSQPQAAVPGSTNPFASPIRFSSRRLVPQPQENIYAGLLIVVEDKLSEAEKRRDELKEELSQQHERHAEIELELAFQRQLVSDLKKRLATAEQECNVLREDLEGDRGRLELSENWVRQMEEARVQLTEEWRRADQERVKAEEELAELRRQMPKMIKEACRNDVSGNESESERIVKEKRARSAVVELGQARLNTVKDDLYYETNLRMQAEASARLAEAQNDCNTERSVRVDAEKEVKELRIEMDGESAKREEAEMRVRQLEARLAEESKSKEQERQRRVDAERVLADVRREGKEPFIVPALLDAFLSVARISNESEISAHRSGRS